MKKIFLSVLLFLCFINVEAKDYYSSYSSYSDWSTNEIESSDIVSVEKSIRYKYYHEDIEGEYYLEDEQDSKYNLKDENKYYYSDYSEYSKLKPEEKKNRVIESVEGYEYSDALKVNRIMINDTHGGANKLYITEIRVLDSNNNDINYDVITCEGCNDQFTNYIHNGIIDERNSYVDNRGFIVLELENEYYFDEITIKVYMYDNTNEYKSYYITLGSLREYHLRYSYYSEFNSNEIKEEIYNYTNMIQNIEWDNPKISLSEVIPNLHTKVDKIPLYRYKDKYIYYYNSNKIYSDYLTKPTAYYNKQSEDSIYLYRYKTRDKISIQDNIVIIDSNDTIDNYYKSTVPVKIEGNIDMSKNGTYHISFITPFKTIEKDVVVNIENNTLKEQYEKLLEEKNNLKTKYDNLVSDYNDKMNAIEEMKDKLNSKESIERDYNDLLKEYQEVKDSSNNDIELYNKMIEDINKYKIRINELNNELINYKEMVNNKNSEKNRMSKEYENELINLRIKNETETPTCKTNSDVRTMPLLTIPHTYFIIPLIFILIVLISYFTYKRIRERRTNARGR